MKKYIKGGIETIVAAVILVGIVIALIIATVIPMSSSTQKTAQAGVNRLGELQKNIDPVDNNNE